MKNIEDYKNDITYVLKGMAKIEAYLDVAAEHKDDKIFEEVFGDFVKNEIISFMKSIDSLTAAMKSSFILEHLTDPMDPEAADIVDVCASIEFIEKRMKTIRANTLYITSIANNEQMNACRDYINPGIFLIDETSYKTVVTNYFISSYMHISNIYYLYEYN